MAILTPPHNATISGDNLVVPIGSGAFDADGIETMALPINDVAHDALTFGGSITDTIWSMADWEPTVSGTYTLTAVMTNTLGTAVSDTITVMIDIEGEHNTAPTAVDDSYTVDQNSSDNSLAVLSNDSDTEDDTLLLVAVSEVQHETAVISGTTILYTPDPGFTGMDTLTYTVSDGDLQTMATVMITVVLASIVYLSLSSNHNHQ